MNLQGDYGPWVLLYWLRIPKRQLTPDVMAEPRQMHEG